MTYVAGADGIAEQLLPWLPARWEEEPALTPHARDTDSSVA